MKKVIGLLLLGVCFNSYSAEKCSTLWNGNKLCASEKEWALAKKQGDEAKVNMKNRELKKTADCNSWLTKQNIIKKINYAGEAGRPYIYVTALFYALDFDDKQVIAAAVSKCFSTTSTGAVTLVDSKSGKRIGTFYQTLGGLHLD